MSKKEENNQILEKDYGIELVESSEPIQKKKDEDFKYKHLSFEDKIKTFRFWKYIIIGFLWLVALKLIEKHTGFGSVFVVVSIFVLIFVNLDYKDRKKGELSAYSIFNEGGKRILGDNPEQMLASFGINTYKGGVDETDNQKQTNSKSGQLSVPKDNKEWMKQISKMGNKPCYCGSEKKYKKCCYWREIRHKEDESKTLKRQVNQEYQEIYDDDN